MKNKMDEFFADPFSFVSSEIERLSSVALYVPNDPHLFPGYYRSLLASGVTLPGDPLARIRKLGRPLAHGSERLSYPVEANILHCCDPSHLANTHFLTVPFFRFKGSRAGQNIPQKGKGTYYISIERGIEAGGLEFFPFSREVTMTFHGPLVFELDTGELSILFQLIPLTEYSHIMEVSLFFTEEMNGWEKPFLPKIGEFFVRTSFAEDATYLDEHILESKAVLAEVGYENVLERLPGLLQYKDLYGNALSELLPKASAVGKQMFH
jgi:hypothetical protein